MLTPPSGSVLVVDDEASVGRAIAFQLSQAGIRVLRATSGEEALTILAREAIDLVLTDFSMPGIDGMELLYEVRTRWSDVSVVMMTAHATIDVAVEAMKLGATDFLIKPFRSETLLDTLHRALEVIAVKPDAPPPPEPVSHDGFVGRSAVMLGVRDLLVRAAQGQSTVLIHGESGTGKELAAKLIHSASPRASGPFVAVNCGAIPPTFIQSELFGHEKGAFTGAFARRIGRLELAKGGTLFLDEIGDITPDAQVALLRVLQERVFERLGGNEKIKADVRVVAATHRSLEEMVACGEFRHDLYFRLNVVPVEMPPLRAHPEDVEALAQHFNQALAKNNGCAELRFEPDAFDALRQHDWPGNVRELQNVIERLVMLSPTRMIKRARVEAEIARAPRFAPVRPSSLPPSRSVPPPSPSVPPPSWSPSRVSDATSTLEERRRIVERETLVEMLQQTKGNRSKAARLLGVSRRTLYNKLIAYGIE